MEAPRSPSSTPIRASSPFAALTTHPGRALAFLLALYSIISAWEFSGRYACIDYYQFWVIGRAVAAHETRDVYSDAERKRIGELYWQRALADAGARDPRQPGEQARTKRIKAASQRQVLETYSTPWLYAVFGLLSGPDYDRSQDAFQHASLVAYLAAIALVALLLGCSPATCALWIAALLQWFNPLVDDVIAGNVNRIQLLLLAVFLWIEVRARFPGRHAAAGALLGVAVAFKPNLAAAALVVLLGCWTAGEGRRLIQSLAGLLVGSLAAVLASGAYFGSLIVWRDWLREFPRLVATGSAAAGSADEGNYSLSRLLHDRAGVSLGPWIAALLLAAVIATLLLERRRRSSSAIAGAPAREVLLVGLGAALFLLAAELAWQHYFVALVPLAMVLLRPVEDGANARPELRALALLGLAMVSLQSVGRLFDLHQPSAGAAVVSAGALLLFAAGLADLSRPSAA
jgi:hypothetical protein